MIVPGGGAATRKQLDEMEAVAKGGGAGGLLSFRRAATGIEVRLSDPAAARELSDLLGPHGDGGARVRLILWLEPDQEVAIDLGDEHRLALGRRMDLERRPGVLGVTDL